MPKKKAKAKKHKAPNTQPLPLVRTSRLDEAKAKFELAESFDKKDDPVQASNCYRKAAELGLSGAQRILGYRLQNGIGCPQNIKEACKWYLEAANQGDAEAQFNLGVLLEEGLGCKQNVKKAVEFYRKAAAEGIPKAQFNLGTILLNGAPGVPANSTEALLLFDQAAKQGFLKAQETLKTLREKLLSQLPVFFAMLKEEDKASKPKSDTKSKTVATSTVERKKNERQASIVEGGTILGDQMLDELDLPTTSRIENAETNFAEGMHYYNGTKMFPLDPEKAFEKFRQAADNNHAKAQSYLGLMLAKGIGCIKNEAEALLYFSKAIENGYTLNEAEARAKAEAEAKAQAEPEIKEQADTEAKEKPEKNVTKSVEKKDEQTESDFVKEARRNAERGNAADQVYLAECLILGEGCKKNEVEAVEWFRQAAMQGNSEAQFNLGVCYFNGMGILEDRTLAAQWLTSAANQGNAEAQYQLGCCFVETPPIADCKDINDPLLLDWLQHETKANKQARIIADAFINLGEVKSDGKDVRARLISYFENEFKQIEESALAILKPERATSTRVIIPLRLSEATCIILTFDFTKEKKPDTTCYLFSSDKEAYQNETNLNTISYLWKHFLRGKISDNPDWETFLKSIETEKDFKAQQIGKPTYLFPLQGLNKQTMTTLFVESIKNCGKKLSSKALCVQLEKSLERLQPDYLKSLASLAEAEAEARKKLEAESKAKADAERKAADKRSASALRTHSALARESKDSKHIYTLRSKISPFKPDRRYQNDLNKVMQELNIVLDKRNLRHNKDEATNLLQKLSKRKKSEEAIDLLYKHVFERKLRLDERHFAKIIPLFGKYLPSYAAEFYRIADETGCLDESVCTAMLDVARNADDYAFVKFVYERAIDKRFFSEILFTKMITIANTVDDFNYAHAVYQQAKKCNCIDGKLCHVYLTTLIRDQKALSKRSDYDALIEEVSKQCKPLEYNQKNNNYNLSGHSYGTVFVGLKKLLLAAKQSIKLEFVLDRDFGSFQEDKYKNGIKQAIMDLSDQINFDIYENDEQPGKFRICYTPVKQHQKDGDRANKQVRFA